MAKVQLRNNPTRLAGVCIIKDEERGEHGLQGNLLKLCSFKIAEGAHGFRFGELLLKAVFDYAFDNSYDHIYVEVFPKYRELIALAEAFGFYELPTSTERGELVLAKKLKFSERDYESLNALDFHVRFGPKYLKVDDAFVVPIRPEYHNLLFPESTLQPTLLSGMDAYGNSIQKAYLCNAPIRQLPAGSVLLFYESGGSAQIRCIGILEDKLVSDDYEVVARYVGQRTVYSLDEIRHMCSSPVLAILFRQALGVVTQPIGVDNLIDNGALEGIPQSITRVKEGGLEWVRDQVELSP